MSDSDSPRPTGSRTSSVAKPPAAQIRRRAAGASQAARPNSTRAAGAGGSSNTMLKLYTDDSPGLRMCVSLLFLLQTNLTRYAVTPSSSSSCRYPSLAPSSSSTSPPRSSAPSPSNWPGHALSTFSFTIIPLHPHVL
ncbi:hypothetical protein CC2G_003296 [Coprinopsis cinerea AmutBmut pab1-1]|nr:hypothetical protein CC2G_003296 [Coprinopsis cinerea AmutBmut pab1-1]